MSEEIEEIRRTMAEMVATAQHILDKATRIEYAIAERDAGRMTDEQAIEEATKILAE